MFQTLAKLALGAIALVNDLTYRAEFFGTQRDARAWLDSLRTQDAGAQTPRSNQAAQALAQTMDDSDGGDASSQAVISVSAQQRIGRFVLLR